MKLGMYDFEDQEPWDFTCDKCGEEKQANPYSYLIAPRTNNAVWCFECWTKYWPELYPEFKDIMSEYTDQFKKPGGSEK